MEYEKIIQILYTELRDIEDNGQVVNYIPELADISPDKFGIAICCIAGEDFGIGDYQEKFSIQSITKVLTLCIAYEKLGEELWKRVDVEPSGTPFNSLVQLETDDGIPRNPFINAGALVVADTLISILENPKEEFLSFVRRLAGQESINYSEEIALSEKKHGFRNIALGNYLKALGNLNNDPDEVLDFYFHQCSLEMTCSELAKAFQFLANVGVNPIDGVSILDKSKCKRINAIMQTCGFYDESGEFAFRVGLPGKSGVGGGIAAIHPGHYSVAVWSPRLNLQGNSFKGMNFLERLTTMTEESIF